MEPDHVPGNCFFDEGVTMTAGGRCGGAGSVQSCPRDVVGAQGPPRFRD